MFQHRRISPVPVFYYVFDFLFLDGYDVTGLPLRERKALLRKSFSFRDHLRFTEHRENDEAEAYAARTVYAVTKAPFVRAAMRTAADDLGKRFERKPRNTTTSVEPLLSLRKL